MCFADGLPKSPRAGLFSLFQRFQGISRREIDVQHFVVPFHFNAVNSQLHAEPVHYKRRHHIHRRGFVVAPNASVTVEGSNGMASKSRTISGNGDGTWNAEGSRSITNYNTGVTCSRNGSFASAKRTGTEHGQ